REPLARRDHTERLLAHLGVRLGRAAGSIEVEGGQRPLGAAVALPGDVSSAAFLVVAALVVPGSELRLPGVGVNPTRTGALAILRRMGAPIEVVDTHDVAGAPRAGLRGRAARLRGTAVAPAASRTATTASRWPSGWRGWWPRAGSRLPTRAWPRSPSRASSRASRSWARRWRASEPPRGRRRRTCRRGEVERQPCPRAPP